MKTIILLYCILIFAATSKAQCSLTQSQGQHSRTFISKLEKVFTNEDFENGVLAFHLRLILNRDNDPKVGNYYLLECVYITSGDYVYGENIPRVIGLVSSAQTSPIQLKALQEETLESKPGFISRKYTYEVDDQALQTINGRISEILFYDSRSQRTIRAKPFDLLLSEQLNCLMATAKK
jgi:hypothetical protein